MHPKAEYTKLTPFGRVLFAAAPLFPLGIYLTLATRWLFDESIGYPDADRLLMDGVFLADFLRELPLLHPLEFAVTYFAQYPALSIGYKPPFFPLVESFFIMGFGEHVWAGRLAVIALGMLGGIAFFATVQRMYGRAVATFASALLASLPYIVWWSWYTMTEIPVLALLLATGFLTWKLAESGNAKWAYPAALVFAATLWTKQSAIFAVLWLLPVLLMSPHRSSLIKQRDVWWSVGLLVLAVLPLAAMTIALGDLNLGQSIGANPRGEQLPRWHPDNLAFYLNAIVDQQASWPLALTALFGAAVGLQPFDRRLIFWLLLFFSTYVFFTALNDPHVDRYTIFLLPAITVFAALPASRLPTPRLRAIYGFWLATLVAWQAGQAYFTQPQRSEGFQEAARLAVDRGQTPVVFIDAYNNGYFTFFVRALDPDRSKYVVRGDKVLSSSAVDTTTWARQHVDSRDQLIALLKRSGADILVLEQENYTNFPIHDLLRAVVMGEGFELLDEIPIVSTLPRYRNQKLLVYRFLSNTGADGPKGISLPLPIIGKELYVPTDGSAPSLDDLQARPE